jgi:hypothetical protein
VFCGHFDLVEDGKTVGGDSTAANQADVFRFAAERAGFAVCLVDVVDLRL